MDEEKFLRKMRAMESLRNLWCRVRDIEGRTGCLPKAIIASGEIYYMIRADVMNVQETADGDVLWYGIPILRGNQHGKVLLVQEMIELDASIK